MLANVVINTRSSPLLCFKPTDHICPFPEIGACAELADCSEYEIPLMIPQNIFHSGSFSIHKSKTYVAKSTKGNYSLFRKEFYLINCSLGVSTKFREKPDNLKVNKA